jgi:surface antigen
MENSMNRRFIRRSAFALVLPLALASCAVTPESCQLNQTATGALVGAGIGSALGAIGAVAGGARAGTGVAIVAGAALAGAAIGTIIGQQRDHACHQLAMKRALDQAMAANDAWQGREAERQMAAGQPAGSRASHVAPARRTASAARSKASSAQSQPEYQTVAWANTMANNHGAITPMAAITEPASKQVCMTFNDQVTNASGQTVVQPGKACRGPDGEWNKVS